MSIEGRDPTPAELVDQLERARNSSSSKLERVMKRVVADAEDLGDEHMGAVAEWVFKQPRPAPQPAPNDLMHTKEGLRYRADDLNVTIELRLTIDGRKFVAREMVDPMLFEMRFAPNEAEFEKYLGFFLQQHLGRLAHGEWERAFFRSKLFIVRPGDEHDLQRCAHSNDGTHQNMWPRCLDGFVLSELPGTSPVPGAGGTIRRDAVLGHCPCRCHKKPTFSTPPPYMPGVGTFDEDQL